MDQPDILRANLSHRRLIRHHGRRTVLTAYQQAAYVCDRWHQLRLHDEDFQRLMTIFHGPTWSVRRTDPTLHAARYPQRVALTKALVNRSWNALSTETKTESAAFVAEVRRTVAPTYRWSLERHYGTLEPLVELLNDRREPSRA